MTLRSLTPRARSLVALLVLVGLTGCTNAYYSAMEQIGQGKRDILRSRIESGRDDQAEAQEQIKTTYERLKEAANFEGGDLEAIYDRLNSDYERCVARADDVSDRIESIEQVAADLWDEWGAEIELIPREARRRDSRRLLDQTKTRYGKVIGAMKRSESKMAPVLEAFRGEVLYLKHNLNARAIASLEDTAVEIQGDVESLIRDIDASIREAESFLDQFESA
ncbi:MAG: DUF2959 family protein [Myxococcota bacterium]